MLCKFSSISGELLLCCERNLVTNYYIRIKYQD